MMKNLSKQVFVWPGQGGQKVGMINHLRSLAVYPDIMHYAKLALEPDSDGTLVQGKHGTYTTQIEKLMIEGPDTELGMTENTCPAMLIMSYLEYCRFKENYRKDITHFQYGLGHSLGELIAATIAGSFNIFDAIKLSKDRAIIMQKNWPPDIGRMLVITADSSYVNDIIEKFKEDYFRTQPEDENHVLSISSMNSYSSTTISGTTKIVDDFLKYLDNLKSKQKTDRLFQIIDLPVSVAGHWKLMTEAQKEYAELLNNIEINDPTVPIVSWVDWTPKYSKDDLVKSLVDSFWLPVNFKGIVQFWINNDIDDYVEFSSRGSMTRLIKNIQINYSKSQ